MKALPDGGVRLAATDLSNHLGCRYLTSLDLSVARGLRAAPKWRAPDLYVIQQLGLKHEAQYLDHLRAQNLEIIDPRECKGDNASVAQTLEHMRRGAQVIAQGSLSVGRWFGKPDILRRVERESDFGAWSYEPYDCKLTRDTKGETILQLGLYAALPDELQGSPPEFIYVVPGGHAFASELPLR